MKSVCDISAKAERSAGRRRTDHQRGQTHSRELAEHARVSAVRQSERAERTAISGVQCSRLLAHCAAKSGRNSEHRHPRTAVAAARTVRSDERALCRDKGSPWRSSSRIPGRIGGREGWTCSAISVLSVTTTNARGQAKQAFIA